MKVENVISFRDEIGKDKILKIVCDNQHIFYDRIAQNSPIIWEDDKAPAESLVLCLGLGIKCNRSVM